MIQQILVPVDFSEPSHAALRYAAELAGSLKAEVDVLHVWEAPFFVPYGSTLDASVLDPSLLDTLQRRSDQALREFVGEAGRRGIVVRGAQIEKGPPAQTITEFAKMKGYDLIVIGTHGRSGISRALLGSVAERVVRLASCPVLTVRPEKS